VNASKRRHKTLLRTPVTKTAKKVVSNQAKNVVARDVAEAQRRAKSGEAARETDRLIRHGMHPIEAFQRARRGVRTTKGS
jgi:hypothetical protein